MNIKEIEKFAIEHGFDGVEYAGKYKGKLAYKPFRNQVVFIGMPFYILIENNKPKLVTGNLGLKILNELYSKEE